MTSISGTIKSRFLPTIFLSPHHSPAAEGNDMGSGTERKMEGEREGGREGVIQEETDYELDCVGYLN